jgi:hypothetical protein
VNSTICVSSLFTLLAAVLDLILMMLNSLLLSLRGQVAFETEIIALRHQLTVLQQNQPKRLVLNRGDRLCLLKIPWPFRILAFAVFLLTSFGNVLAAFRFHEFPARRLSLPRCTPRRDHRVAPSTHRAATHAKTEAVRPLSRRSMPLGLAFTLVVRLAIISHHRETRNGDRVASPRISVVLDLEDSPWPVRPPSGSKGNTRSDSSHEP